MGFVKKIGVTLQRAFFSKKVPLVSDIKLYGEEAEFIFEKEIKKLLPDVEIKTNVLISTASGKCEIDCLIKYNNKLFVAEIKRWKGKVFELNENFLIQKKDLYTNEVHEKIVKSPFKQLQRQIFLLKEYSHANPWVNAIAFFAETEELQIRSDAIYFCDIDSIAHYIRTGGRASDSTQINRCFNSCKSADYIYTGSAISRRAAHCVIQSSSLRFIVNGVRYTKNEIGRINVKHHLSYDDLEIILNSGKIVYCRNETDVVYADENDGKGYKVFSISKIDGIIVGK